MLLFIVIVVIFMFMVVLIIMVVMIVMVLMPNFGMRIMALVILFIRAMIRIAFQFYLHRLHCAARRFGQNK